MILVVALIFLGPSRLPGAARSVGKGMREFRESLAGIGDDPRTIPTTSSRCPDEDEVEDVEAPTPRSSKERLPSRKTARSPSSADREPDRDRDATGG